MEFEQLQFANLTICPFEDLSDRSKPVRVRDLNPEVDLITGINDVSFDDAWFESIERIIDPAISDGCRVRTLSKAHLVLSKKDSGRPVDASDIEALRRSL